MCTRQRTPLELVRPTVNTAACSFPPEIHAYEGAITKKPWRPVTVRCREGRRCMCGVLPTS